MKKEFILTVEGVSKSFEGFKAISNLNFYMDDGELGSSLARMEPARRPFST